jgi:4-hydroxy-3-methylbut-2-enyl diphosphate reductase
MLAKSAGFCFGVKRAVRLAEEAAKENKSSVMLGPVIHNDAMIERLEKQGVQCVQQMEEIPPDTQVIIRSHGESKAVQEVLQKKGCPVIDATCPNVSKIHNIVADASARGRKVFIIGIPTHPEVMAIAGWCEDKEIFESVEEMGQWLTENSAIFELPITMVSQTTLSEMIWNPCREKLKKECTNYEIFDTICRATCKRQSEALSLAEQCDAMLIIGDHKSSNTNRLAELCRAHCPLVVHISRAEELDLTAFSRAASVGITAGASTPGWIIKEVFDKMSDEIMEIEESFAEMLEKSIKTLNTGDKVTGIITRITPTEIHVDLGTKHAGYIPVSELTDDLEVKLEDLLHVGDEIETYVMRVNDLEGVVTLSKKRLDSVKNWDNIEKAQEDQANVEGIVTEENKGGIVVSVKGIRVFVPASQTGLPRGAEMSELLKQKVRLRITEVNRSRRRVVGSIRAVNNEERTAKAAEIWNNIEAGKKYSGTVKSLTSYGAFVDIGGVDGMVHVSELSWSRIKSPADIISVGDKVEVHVLSFDPEKKKISLGMKDHGEDPWAKFTSTYEVGSVANVRVVKLMAFGAFAEIVPGVDGLIHISQIADHRVEKPGDELKEGQTVDVKITEIDFENKKVSLSIRALLNEANQEADGVEEAAQEEA